MFVVKNSITGKVYDRSRSNDMKDCINRYVTVYILVDEYSEEEFNMSIMQFMENYDLEVISL